MTSRNEQLICKEISKPTFFSYESDQLIIFWTLHLPSNQQITLIMKVVDSIPGTYIITIFLSRFDLEEIHSAAWGQLVITLLRRRGSDKGGRH